MKLPQIDVYAFPVTIPSTGKEIKMRPYLVREEKLLLMAQENDNFKEQTSAITQVIENCTNREVDVKTAPYFDIEYLMLQLRARSIGETATPIYICNNKVNGVECGNQTSLKLSINDIKISNTNISTAASDISIGNDYVLSLHYPNIFDINEMVDTIQENSTKSNVIDNLTNLFSVLKNTKTGETFDLTTNTKEEKVEFLEEQSPTVLKKIIEFFEEMPKIEHTVEYTCSKCGFDHYIYLSGLRSFLEFWESTTPS